MKAVIFNCSLKYPKQSDTHYYCRTIKNKFDEVVSPTQLQTALKELEELKLFKTKGIDVNSS